MIACDHRKQATAHILCNRCTFLLAHRLLLSIKTEILLLESILLLSLIAPY